MSPKDVSRFLKIAPLNIKVLPEFAANALKVPALPPSPVRPQKLATVVKQNQQLSTAFDKKAISHWQKNQAKIFQNLSSIFGFDPNSHSFRNYAEQQSKFNATLNQISNSASFALSVRHLSSTFGFDPSFHSFRNYAEQQSKIYSILNQMPNSASLANLALSIRQSVSSELLELVARSDVAECARVDAAKIVNLLSNTGVIESVLDWVESELGDGLEDSEFYEEYYGSFAYVAQANYAGRDAACADCSDSSGVKMVCEVVLGCVAVSLVLHALELRKPPEELKEFVLSLLVEFADVFKFYVYQKAGRSILKK